MNFVSTIIFVGVKILLGDVIKNRRSAKGWTQGAFAKKLAVSIGYISEIETGRRMPSLNMLLSMIDLLECTPNEILEYNGREEQDVKEKAEPYLCSSGTDETIASTVRMMLTMTPEERFKVFVYAKDQKCLSDYFRSCGKRRGEQ